MVSLIGRSRGAEGRELEAPIAAYRAATAVLPDRDAPLIDRLFALECLTRAGREARATRDQLLPARRTAEDYIDVEWEADVPHVNVLGQALAVIDALDDDPPASWADLLDETLVALERRQHRFGIRSAPLVIASVIRGLAAIGQPAPYWLLDATRGYFEAGPTATIVAELADALHRHRNGVQLAHQAAEIVFSERHAADDGVAIARWWLAERMGDALNDVATPEKVATARAQALTTVVQIDSRLAPMLAELAGRAVGSLVLLSATELEQARVRARGGAIVENYFWRAVAAVALLGLGVIYSDRWLSWIGVKPTSKVVSGVTAGLVAAAVYVVMVALESSYKRLGRDTPPWMNQAQVIVPLIAGAIAYFLSP